MANRIIKPTSVTGKVLFKNGQGQGTFQIDTDGNPQFTSMTSAGVVKNAAGGSVSSGPISDADVAAGAAIAGSKVVAASATVPGMVTTGAQTFAGKKTFNTPPTTQVVQSGIAAGSGTLDAAAYDTFVKAGSASATNIGLNNMYEGQTITVLIATVASQATITWKRGTDAAGAADVKWNSGVIPTPTTVAGRYDRYIFQMLGGVIFGSADMNCY
jgi:hypothetical protein